VDNCQSCHGVDGGGVPFSNVQGKSSEEIDAAIIGEPSMNSLESLSPAEIDAIAAFLDM
jgi:mono/diheme cytochrome c family protein